MRELTFHDLLESPTESVYELLDDQKPLVLSKDTSIQMALQALKEQKLRSCLLSDSAGPVHESDSSLCMFDMRGVVHSFVHTYKPETQTELKNFLRMFNQKKVRDLKLTAHSDMQFCDIKETVYAVVSKFSVSPRVFICKDDVVMRCFGVMDFIQLVRVAKCFEHLNDESRLYSSLVSTKARDISSARCVQTSGSQKTETSDVVSAQATQIRAQTDTQKHTHALVALDDSNSLNDALRLFDSTQYSALPIVDVDTPSKCHGILSVRDLFTLFLHTDEIPNDILTSPAIEYLTLVKRKMPKASFPYIHTKEGAPFLSVISKIITTHIHRVLITNDVDEITGIVSVTDIAYFLVREIQNNK